MNVYRIIDESVSVQSGTPFLIFVEIQEPVKKKQNTLFKKQKEISKEKT